MSLTAIYKKEIDQTKIRKSVLISFGITGGMCLVLAVLPSLFLSFSGDLDVTYQLPDWYISALVQDREALLVSDAWRSFFFILIAAAILYVCAMP